MIRVSGQLASSSSATPSITGKPGALAAQPVVDLGGWPTIDLPPKAGDATAPSGLMSRVRLNAIADVEALREAFPRLRNKQYGEVLSLLASAIRNTAPGGPPDVAAERNEARYYAVVLCRILTTDLIDAARDVAAKLPPMGAVEFATRLSLAINGGGKAEVETLAGFLGSLPLLDDRVGELARGVVKSLQTWAAVITEEAWERSALVTTPMTAEERFRLLGFERYELSFAGAKDLIAAANQALADDDPRWAMEIARSLKAAVTTRTLRRVPLTAEEEQAAKKFRLAPAQERAVIATCEGIEGLAYDGWARAVARALVAETQENPGAAAFALREHWAAVSQSGLAEPATLAFIKRAVDG